MGRKYIDAGTFEDFKNNQDVLIGILNHNMTEIKNDFKKFSENFIKVCVDVGEIKGSFKVSQKIFWWMMGILGTVGTLIIIGVISSR